jgi:hypothetical protein
MSSLEKRKSFCASPDGHRKAAVLSEDASCCENANADNNAQSVKQFDLTTRKKATRIKGEVHETHAQSVVTPVGLPRHLDVG